MMFEHKVPLTYELLMAALVLILLAALRYSKRSARERAGPLLGETRYRPTRSNFSRLMEAAGLALAAYQGYYVLTLLLAFAAVGILRPADDEYYWAIGENGIMVLASWRYIVVPWRDIKSWQWDWQWDKSKQDALIISYGKSKTLTLRIADGQQDEMEKLLAERVKK